MWTHGYFFDIISFNYFPHILSPTTLTFFLFFFFSVYFSFFTISWTKDLTTSAYIFLLSFIKLRTLLFHLEETLYYFSFVYLNCQHTYPWALGPLWSKISVT